MASANMRDKFTLHSEPFHLYKFFVGTVEDGGRTVPFWDAQATWTKAHCTTKESWCRPVQGHVGDHNEVRQQAKDEEIGRISAAPVRATCQQPATPRRH